MANLTKLYQNTYTSDGANKIINLPSGADYIRVLNQTEATAANDRKFLFEWFPNLNAGEAFATNKTGGGNSIQYDLITSGGITYRSSYPAPEAAKTGTVITAANPAVCTATSHGYSVGDRVRITNNTVMKQISGMEFTITAVADPNTFTLGYLDASGFAAAETGFSARRLAPELETLPGARWITKVTQAASAVVTFSEAHPYKVGDLLYFRVPSSFDMTQLDGITAKVTAIATSTVTLDLNSSAFTAFAFPLTSEVPFSFAFAGPAGKRGLYDDWFSSSRSLLNLDPFRSGQFVPYMLLPGGAGNPNGSANDVITYQVWTKEN
jgi:hypothetical protein